MLDQSTPVQETIRVPFYINRAYLLFWAAQTISILGDYVFNTTLMLWIVTIIAPGQGWGPLAVSGLLLAELLPSFLVGPFAGVFVDRWEIRRVLLTMDLLRAALIGLLALCGTGIPVPLLPGGHLSAGWQLSIIYLIVFSTSLCSQFFNPARFRLLADVIPEIYRARATGFAQSSMNIAVILGPSLAAPLFFLIGLPWLLVFNAVSFLFSFLMLFQIHLSQKQTANTLHANVQPFWRDFGDGVRFLLHERVLVTLLLSMCLILFSAGLTAPLGIFFATHNLQTPTSFYGLFGAASGIGLLAGSLVLGWLGPQLGLARLFALGTLFVGLLECIYSRQDLFWLACIILLVQGIPNAAMNVAFSSLVLRFTPEAYIGRVWALILPAMNLSQLVSTALSGYLVSTFFLHFHRHLLGINLGPYDTLILISGLISVAAGIFALLRLRGVDAVHK